MQQVSRIALTPRLQNGALDYMGAGRWRLWLHTIDFVHGTYLDMYSNGRVDRITCRENEGDDVVLVKPGEK